MLNDNDRPYLPREIPGEDIRRIFGGSNAFNYEVFINGEGADGSNASTRYTCHASEDEAIAQADRVNDWAAPLNASAGLAMPIDSFSKESQAIDDFISDLYL